MDQSPTNPPTPNEPHVLCDTDSKCEAVLPALRSSPILILDCEGRDLGDIGGALSIIILRTTTADPRTYLIDVKSLSTTTLNSVFDLLFSPKVQKIVFDGRSDFSALYHEYGVELYNVIDMQLVDIKSREARGERLEEQLKRLCGPFAPREVWKNRGFYDQVHNLAGLERCLTEHQCVKAKGGSNLRPKVDHQSWMERPLSLEYLDYAARDARLIHLLFETFTTAGWTKLLSSEESMRYVTFHKYSQPKNEDQYMNHSLLPLGILNPPMRTCSGCERRLPFEAFARTNSGRQCYVCRAITKRIKDKPSRRERDRYRKGNPKATTGSGEVESPVSAKAEEGKGSDGEYQTIHSVVISY